MKSLSFAKKLDQRFCPDPIEEDIKTLIDMAGSLNSFQNCDEFNDHLAEGSLLNVSKIASKSLSIPCGEYMVWTTDSGNTMLVPTNTDKPVKEVYENAGRAHEIFTKDLLNHWNTIERVLAEGEEEGKEQPSEKNNDEDSSSFQSNINMSTVDRTPIARAMEQHGHTVTSLARACNVDPPAISRILREPQNTQGDPGGRNPSIGLAAQISHELKMDAEALFPDIFGTPKGDLEARDQPGNRGSGMDQAASGSTKKGKATKMWTRGNR